jgi:hypothetical protein
MKRTIGVVVALVAVAGPVMVEIATSGSENAFAAPAKTRRAPRGTTKKAMAVELVLESSPPEGEPISMKRVSPACVGQQDGDPSTMTVHTRDRSLEIRIESEGSGGGSGGVGVYEGRRRLWWKDVSSAGGPDSSGACSHDGWGVVLAGNGRHGDDVYDLFTGKKLGPGDVSAYAPDLSWALVPPSSGWASGCFQMSRTFRVLTDGSRRPYSLDTPPTPDCTEDNAGVDAPKVAISPNGKLYAVGSSKELGLYRASDDVKVARFAKPPYSDKDRPNNGTSLDFSVTGRYLVLSRSWTYGDKGERVAPTEAHWFRIRKKKS